VELPACGIESALQRFFRFQCVDEGATLVIDPVDQNLLDALPSYFYCRHLLAQDFD